ncbi:MAG: hypothetical protein KC619_26935 [Myxococcales bacterium]|nr:hypothetical protein [Myxococcales bacterium]
MTWREGPIEVAAEGYVRCWECRGQQRCPCCGGARQHASPDECFGPILSTPPRDHGTTRCVQCAHSRGWCYLCGGAGQIPLDPAAPWDRPAFALVRRECVRDHR